MGSTSVPVGEGGREGEGEGGREREGGREGEFKVYVSS